MSRAAPAPRAAFASSRLAIMRTKLMAATSSGRASPRSSVEGTTLASAVLGTQREPHWNVTLLVPSELVTMLCHRLRAVL